MMALILETARRDERVRAVYMNGSRVNQNAPRDIFQDYDVVYVVTETGPFYRDEAWIDRFGERLYMQRPEKLDAMVGGVPDFDANYGWLMQFADGNRLDLHVQSVPYATAHIREDRLCAVLLDKDGVLPPLPPATDADYHVKKPAKEDFTYCCNEFWWCLNNVAKGLWRKEIPYAMDMLNFYIRPQLIKMLSWGVGLETDFSCGVGKSGKYLRRYLPPERWDRLLRTYPDGTLTHMWRAALTMCDLFDEAAREVAVGLGYRYDQGEAEVSRGFLRHVRGLPENAERIF